jgi:hypothetical protein
MNRKRILALVGAGALAAALIVPLSLLGNPIDAWRAYQAADKFMGDLAKGDYAALAPRFSADIRARVEQRPENMRFELPRLTGYSLRGLRRLGAAAYEIRFRLNSNDATTMRLTVAPEGPKLVVKFVDPPGI